MFGWRTLSKSILNQCRWHLGRAHDDNDQIAGAERWALQKIDPGCRLDYGIHRATGATVPVGPCSRQCAPTARSQAGWLAAGGPQRARIVVMDFRRSTRDRRLRVVFDRRYSAF